MKSFTQFLTESKDVSTAEGYIAYEKAEVERAVASLFKGASVHYNYNDKGAPNGMIGVRTYQVKFNQDMPFVIRFSMSSKTGFYGKQGAISKLSTIYMSPDAKNSKRATFIDLDKTSNAEFDGNEKKGAQVAVAYLKSVKTKIDKAISGSKFTHPDVQNLFGSDIVSKISSVI